MYNQLANEKFETNFYNSVIKFNRCVDNDVDYGRIFVEILLYISITCQVFGNKLGILNITGLSGSIIVISGFTCAVVMVIKKEHFSHSMIFVFIITVIANLTDFIIIEYLPRHMLHWMSLLLMTCYIVRDDRAAIRFEYFLAATVLLSVAIGGIYIGQQHGHERLALGDRTVGSIFANSNALAQVAYMTAISLLFSSFKSKLITKFICLIFAISLSMIVLMTLSRQGLFMLTIGIIFYILSSVFYRYSITGIIVYITSVFTISFFYSEFFEKIISGYIFRFGLSSDRIAYWATAQKDMLETLISGKGTLNAISSVGIIPHNTFLWIHLAYGGLCALIYASWLIWLAIKTCQISLQTDTDRIMKMQVFVLFILFFFGQFSTIFAPGNYGYILGIALMEKNFSAFAHNKIT